MKVKIDKDAFTPVRKHPTDAGMDIASRESADVPAKGSRVFSTGVYIELPKGCAGLLVSRSGLNIVHKLTSTGLIDEGYTGEIMVRLYNDSDVPYHVERGDRITQLVVIPVRYEPVELVDEIDGGERGTDGYGSTGR